MMLKVVVERIQVGTIAVQWWIAGKTDLVG
jgi:hypothetical protein